ncbi:ThiF family adenylyltransferase, partial [Streptococcus pneumoniae]|nr:ThiF family adenylyltransferase [Streptococcus pneumoniae]
AIGVRDIICIDGDKIELDNLTRQILYTPGDIEKNLFKVSALESRIKD